MRISKRITSCFLPVLFVNISKRINMAKTNIKFHISKFFLFTSQDEIAKLYIYKNPAQ